MIKILTPHIIRLLKRIINDLESDNCSLTETEALDMIKLFGHKRLSKEQACDYLNLSRSRFDDLVREGKIPKGKKENGYKELSWYEDELFLITIVK